MKYSNKFILRNKIAYVLGGSGLIGQEICLALSELGAEVLNLDIKKNKKLLINSETRIKYIYFDISKLNNSEKILNKLIQKYGMPNIFINCSFPYTKSYSKSSFSEITLKSIQENVNLHMNSFIWFARLIAEKMKNKKIAGSIIQLGSIYGVVGQNLNIYKNTNMKEKFIYSAVKGGIINSTRLMASYYGKYNIRINALCPGGIRDKTQNKKFVMQYSRNTPLKRMGKPEEIASAALFLASDASSYITGTTFMVDGGWTSI